MITTLSYTKNPDLSFPQQIRNFLLANGASTGKEIALGILRRPMDAMYVSTEISVACQRMVKNGLMDREKRGRMSFWSFKGTDAELRTAHSKAGSKAVHSLLPKLQSLAANVDGEIRDSVITEMFLRLCSHRNKYRDMNKLLSVSVRAVRKESAKWRESVSLDATVGESSTFHDLKLEGIDDSVPTEEIELENWLSPPLLTIVEARVEQIRYLLSIGFELFEVQDFFWSGPRAIVFWKSIGSGDQQRQQHGRARRVSWGAIHHGIA